MKPLYATLLTLALIAGTLSAKAQGSDIIIKQRAQQIRDANNAQQGVAPPSAPPPSAAMPPAPSVPQGPNAEQMQLIDRLGTDLTAIKPGDSVTADQKQQLQTDFLTLAKGVAKPSKELTKKLADDLAAGLADKNVSTAKQKELARDINVVVNSVRLSSAQVQTFVTSAQTLLKNANVPDAAVQTITADLNAIIADLQKSRPKLYQ
jgi:hypothetical protein